jgi:hypothetical protein
VMNVAEDPRAGLELTRYHSWTRIRDQSTGEHSCQIMRILLTVWPDCPRRMLVHAVTHDMCEMAGDFQYPYKRVVAGLKEASDRAEHYVNSQMSDAFGVPPATALSDYEHHVFKLVEFLEMWEHGLREMNMGNRYARIIASRCILQASGMLEEMSEMRGDAPDIRPAIQRYVTTRTKWEMQE